MPRIASSSNSLKSRQNLRPYTKQDFDYWKGIFMNVHREGPAPLGQLDMPFLDELRDCLPNQDSLIFSESSVLGSRHSSQRTVGQLVSREPTELILDPVLSSVLPPHAPAGGPSVEGVPPIDLVSNVLTHSAPDMSRQTSGDVDLDNSGTTRDTPTTAVLAACKTSPTGPIAGPSSSPSASSATTPSDPEKRIIVEADRSFVNFIAGVAKETGGRFSVHSNGDVSFDLPSIVHEQQQQTVARLGSVRTDCGPSEASGSGLRRDDTLILDDPPPAAGPDPTSDVPAEYVIKSSLDNYISKRLCVPQLVYPTDPAPRMHFCLSNGLLGLLLRDVLLGVVPGGIDLDSQLVLPLLGVPLMELEIVWPGYARHTAYIAINADTTRGLLALLIVMEINVWWFHASLHLKIAPGFEAWNLNPIHGPAIPWHSIFLKSIHGIEHVKPCKKWMIEFDIDERSSPLHLTF